MSIYIDLFRHDLRLLARRRSEGAALILFFLVVVLLLPFAVGPEPETLARLAPGLVWIAALLMSLLSLDGLFAEDARDGTLDLMLLSPLPLPALAACRTMSRAAAMTAALALMAFPAGLMLGMKAEVAPVFALTLALGVPSLALLGGTMAAIGVALRRTPALLTVLLAPFYIPILIFAVSACDAVALGGSARPHLLMLGAALAFLLPSAPFVLAAALRNAQG